MELLIEISSMFKDFRAKVMDFLRNLSSSVDRKLWICLRKNFNSLLIKNLGIYEFMTFYSKEFEN